MARRVPHQLHAHIQCADQRRLVLAASQQAVRPLIRRVERPMRLEDDVGLPGYKVARAVGVRKDRRGRCLLGCDWRHRPDACRLRRIRQLRIHRLRRHLARKAEERHNHQHRHQERCQPFHRREEEDHPSLILAVLWEWGANVHAGCGPCSWFALPVCDGLLAVCVSS